MEEKNRDSICSKDKSEKPEEIKRDTSISARKEKVRESKKIYFCPSPAELKTLFAESVSEFQSMLLFAQTIEKTNEDIAFDIYRQQIVNLESIFDFICHSIIKYGFMKMHRNEWNKTDKYSKFQINLVDAEKYINDCDDEKWLLEAVDNKTKTTTLMAYKDIKDNFNYICTKLVEDAAEKVYAKGNPSDNLKEIHLFLDELYERRNVIAHQNDRQHSTGIKNPITYTEVSNYIDTLTKIVNAFLDVLDEIPDLED